MQTLLPVIQAIRNDLRAATRLDQRSVELDIRARRHEANGGLRWAKARTRIRAECEARGITEQEWCKKRLGCHIATMQRRVQLAKHFAEYERKRRSQGNKGQWGLEHALSLIPVNRRYVMNSGVPRDQIRSAMISGTSGRPTLDLSRCTFIIDDALVALRKMLPNSVRCIITSPPFWPFRREFGGEGIGIGFEPTFAEHLAKLMAVFTECQRVLKPDGTMWVEYGDAYSHSDGQWRPGQMNKRTVSDKQLISKDVPMLNTTGEFAEKTVMMIPQRIAIALIDAGWVLRSHIIWDKGFARPDSAQDRPTVSHSNIYLLVKQQNYMYSNDPTRTPTAQGRESSLPGHKKQGVVRRDLATERRSYLNPLGRNCGTVWRCNISNYRGSHPATMPTALIRPMILASCNHPDDRVLDPFGGAGTTALVALQLGFRATTIDIHPAYTEEARHRIALAPVEYEFTHVDEQVMKDWMFDQTD